MQLRLDLAQDVFVFLQNLVDVAAQLARFGVDDLVFFLDTNGQGGRFHRGDTIKVATLEPPPAVTFTSDSVESLLISPSMYWP